MSATRATDALKQAAGLSIAWAIAMIVLGLLALAMPLAAGIGISILVAWIIVFGGIAHFLTAFGARSAGGLLWRVLLAIIYVGAGIYLLTRPGLSLESLTLVLAVIFLAEGVLQLILYLRMRSLPGSGWMLFDGIATLVLGLLIWRTWPSSAAWAIGIIVGVNLIVSGLTRLMLSVAARKAARAIA